ncbi:PadR family transcriptional regulator [Curtobacterium herbarum]|uniref:Transcription regulator PadR N-terminal domain-containing protein n=1 Tax=Curtobacterium herbarum TaxID=150122 RepID=A0ABN1ZFF7_9MICO|nr:helix-turn-helix transcriptional regulator [Curtobacterium herbarum]MBM7474466.1 DNA-binding IclR family transcriptional regulator [Curtobacterium herbarum]MCS6545851.1 PadR family transcriptional regulator [Curtobacterium herbarum]
MDPIRRVTAPTLEVLDALLASDGPTWGLLVIKATGRPAGTVYPILERLEQQGWTRSSWDDDADRSGPRRRLHEFTADGAVAARELVRARGDAARAAARTAGTARPTHRPVAQ